MVHFNHYLVANSLILAGAVVRARQCQNITIPVSLTAENAVLNIPAPVDDVEVTNFILTSLKSIRDGATSTPEAATISGQYELAATYCEPDAGASSVLQILTHGIGFDRSYWDFPTHQHNYSYVNYALDRGYSALFWDRVGFGASTIGDPVSEIQQGLSVAALRELTLLARGGEIPGLPAAFEKIVHVGHSQGSSYTNTLTTMYPTISDGMVLTGFSHVSEYQPWGFISLHLSDANSKPGLEKYPHGYLVSGDEIAVQMVFFAPGQFDRDVLDAAYANAQPITVGEMATTGQPTMNHMTGPVAVITGRKCSALIRINLLANTFFSVRADSNLMLLIEGDIIFCGLDCYATGDPNVPSLLSVSEGFYPNTTGFYPKVIDGAGHGLNLVSNPSRTLSIAKADTADRNIRREQLTARLWISLPNTDFPRSIPLSLHPLRCILFA